VSEDAQNMDWSSGTWEGSRIQKLMRWRALPLRAKLDALDELRSFGDQMLNKRKEAGLPYIEPSTGSLVSEIAEDSTKYNEHRDQQS